MKIMGSFKAWGSLLHTVDKALGYNFCFQHLTRFAIDDPWFLPGRAEASGGRPMSYKRENLNISLAILEDGW